jgi:hypothetical protein
VLPLILILLSVGIEVSQFFGMREEVLERLDNEMVAALRTGDTDAQVLTNLRGRLHTLRPHLMVEEATIQRSGGLVEGIARARYRGPLLELVGQLTGGAVTGAPMEVVSRARRPRSALLIILDRSIEMGSESCADKNLATRAEAVAKLVERFRSAGVASVQVGVVPGGIFELELIGEGDHIPRCPSGESSLPRIGSIQGSSRSVSPDPLAVALRIIEIVVGLSDSGQPEQRSVIMVAPHFESSLNLVTTSFALLENEAGRQRVSLQATGVVVDESDQQNFFTVKSPSGRSSYLRVSNEEVTGASFQTALVQQARGRAVIAR